MSPRRGRTHGACLALALLLAASCSRRDTSIEDASAESVADTPHVTAEEETYFTDLPGVAGFDALTPELQASVAARANRAKCDCGCFGHSINACLHQREECGIAVRTATRFVDDARLGMELAGLSAPAPAPLVEPADVAPEGGEGATMGGVGPAEGAPARDAAGSSDAPGAVTGVPAPGVVVAPVVGEAPSGIAPAGSAPEPGSMDSSAAAVPAGAAATTLGVAGVVSSPGGAPAASAVAPPGTVTPLSPGGLVASPPGAIAPLQPGGITPTPVPGPTAPPPPRP